MVLRSPAQILCQGRKSAKSQLKSGKTRKEFWGHKTLPWTRPIFGYFDRKIKKIAIKIQSLPIDWN
jgi:hypothetical protein